MCTVFSSIRRRTGIPSSNRKARCVAVGFTQRFSEALNYDPHIQLMSLDGVSIENSNGELALRRVGPPRDVDVSRVALDDRPANYSFVCSLMESFAGKNLLCKAVNVRIW
jgi:hypothetical protein